MKGKLIYGMLLFMLVLNAAWQWTHFPLPVLKHAVVPPSLPVVAKNRKQLKMLLAHNLWDKSRGEFKQKSNSELEVKKVALLTWTLKGIGHQQMHAPVAVIASGDDVKSYHEGDILPDEALLVQVMARGILVEKDGKEQRVYLFKKK